jgi:hypothetical protein
MMNFVEDSDAAAEALQAAYSSFLAKRVNTGNAAGAIAAIMD